ncbi:MAG: GNAT family N-acetyltransferase [Alteromonadaceae bacterium]|nr:GNAT family N-acetyltransferase [Alteromonadaceae bacterium]
MAIDVNKSVGIVTDEFTTLAEGLTVAETDRLIIRPLSLSDAEMILVLLNEPTFIKNIADKGVRDLEGARDYIINGAWAMHELHGFSLYCCQRKCDGKTIGISGLFKREGVDHPEVAFAFLEKYCQQGYGFESVSAVIDYARDILQLKCLQAITNTTNQASIKLLEKAGFNFLNVTKIPSIDNEINLFELGL